MCGSMRGLGVVMEMDTDVVGGGQRQTLFTTLYEKDRRRAGAGILKVAGNGVKDVHAAEFDFVGMENKVGRPVCRNSETVGNGALWASSAERLYLVVKKKYFLEIMTRRIRAVLVCFVAFCSENEMSFEMLKLVRV